MERKEISKQILKELSNKRSKAFVENFNALLKGWFVLLNVLQQNGGQMQFKELAKELNVSTARLAVALNKSCEEGFTERVKLTTGSRATYVHLTKLGEIELMAKQELIVTETTKALQKLDESEVLALLEIVKKL